MRTQRGFSLVELMVALGIGLFLVAAVGTMYMAQSSISKTTVSQASVQNAENAISALLIPAIRSAGFTGCSNLTQFIATLNNGGPPPVGSLNSASAQPPMIIGFDASGTDGSGSSLTISTGNDVNDTNASDWNPSLDSTLVGSVSAGSDVLVILGAVPGANPIEVTAVSVPGVSTSLSLQNTTGLSAFQLASVTDCGKTNIFLITAVTPTSVSHSQGSGSMTNTTDFLPVSFGLASQLIPLQQTAYYVAHGQGDQSTLMQAIYSNNVWTSQPLVPGVDSMQVLYGVGSAGVVSQYMPANKVSDWTTIQSVRIGFLIEGQKGSANTSNLAAQSFSVLGTTIKVPSDGRLRHVFEMTINLRNGT
ncbi:MULTISPECIES: PilW family protein [unclassified Undibacterium]|uniref:PilW family protein n=1 Tax=unclassified Undibacterium TaxID=2630295 RepID=UPI003397D20D